MIIIFFSIASRHDCYKNASAIINVFFWISSRQKIKQVSHKYVHRQNGHVIERKLEARDGWELLLSIEPTHGYKQREIIPKGIIGTKHPKFSRVTANRNSCIKMAWFSRRGFYNTYVYIIWIARKITFWRNASVTGCDFDGIFIHNYIFIRIHS